NVVYVGGDRQPDNSEVAGGQTNGVFDGSGVVGATGCTGRLFPGDFRQPRGLNAQTRPSNQWTPITDKIADIDGVPQPIGTTPRTAPHADTRSLLVSGGVLYETDDGGIYRRSNPKSSTGVWSSVNGNIRDSEFTGIAYDPLNNVLLAGAQDNGNAVQ